VQGGADKRPTTDNSPQKGDSKTRSGLSRQRKHLGWNDVGWSDPVAHWSDPVAQAGGFAAVPFPQEQRRGKGMVSIYTPVPQLTRAFYGPEQGLSTGWLLPLPLCPCGPAGTAPLHPPAPWGIVTPYPIETGRQAPGLAKRTQA